MNSGTERSKRNRTLVEYLENSNYIDQKLFESLELMAKNFECFYFSKNGKK
jgi:hypothetical protein